MLIQPTIEQKIIVQEYEWDNSKNSTIDKNIVKNSYGGNGITLEDSDNVVIKNNIIDKSKTDGISSLRSNNIKIINNTIRNNGFNGTNTTNIMYSGINIIGDNQTIINNTIINNNIGITITDGQFNNISGNNIEKNRIAIKLNSITKNISNNILTTTDFSIIVKTL